MSAVCLWLHVSKSLCVCVCVRVTHYIMSASIVFPAFFSLENTIRLLPQYYYNVGCLAHSNKSSICATSVECRLFYIGRGCWRPSQQSLGRNTLKDRLLTDYKEEAIHPHTHTQGQFIAFNQSGAPGMVGRRHSLPGTGKPLLSFLILRMGVKTYR